MGLELRMGRNDYVIFDFGSKMQKKKKSTGRKMFLWKNKILVNIEWWEFFIKFENAKQLPSQWDRF